MEREYDIGERKEEKWREEIGERGRKRGKKDRREKGQEI